MLHNKAPDWLIYSNLFPESVADRQIFILDINVVQASCAMSVHYFKFDGDRDDLAKWSER
ncbi:hypothetical protein [Psychromonas sp. MB-3u-54]|uniref:hypothetical protein n=1 Tax=Psychromonas sp. MB-3u-54 TaxID=2058319 RepID=UPI001E4BF0DE|nr:hypothetical protein [Psychromonas sp. MB-3u-54]